MNATHTEIRAQRDRIAALMGQIRDPVHEWPQDGARRITTGNATLQQRLRPLTRENRVLEARLQAARSSGRFADRPTPEPRPPGMPRRP